MAGSRSDRPSSHGPARPQFERAGSLSPASAESQTAQEFISSQLQLEADAREALPYQFDTCTRPLGPLRQLLFSCLSCTPPPSDPTAPYSPAGVCYSCSISCHGEHTLVELFNKRNFVCDCGTTRIPSSAPCTIRPDARGQKGNVTGEKPAEGNRYNQNFGNKFCGCAEDYNAHTEKGTMFQCLGLGTTKAGGCGEDWWHPECLVGLPRGWWKKEAEKTEPDAGLKERAAANGAETNGTAEDPVVEDEDVPLPPGFPSEDDFDGLLCYKCVDAFPWIRRYAGTQGFLPAVYHNPPTGEQEAAAPAAGFGAESKKRKAEDDDEEDSSSAKRQRSSSGDAAITAPSQALTIDTPTAAPSGEISGTTTTTTAPAPPKCLYTALPTPPTASTPFSLLLQPNFREHLCRCPSHFPLLTPHPHLLEEEDTYEPPLSESSVADGPQSAGSKSLLDRGEAALSNMDRVRAIEGVMVYNHLKDKVKNFLQPFAESGTPVGAEDIKKYFETLRGDAEAMKAMRAQQMAAGGEGDGDGDNRREQGGY